MQDISLGKAGDASLEHLKLMRKCPLCQSGYAPDSFHVLDKEEEATLVHMTCSACRGAVVSVVVVSPLGISSLGLLTDLSASEITALRDRPALSEDALLSFHASLRERGVVERVLAPETFLKKIHITSLT